MSSRSNAVLSWTKRTWKLNPQVLCAAVPTSAKPIMSSSSKEPSCSSPAMKPFILVAQSLRSCQLLSNQTRDEDHVILIPSTSKSINAKSQKLSVSSDLVSDICLLFFLLKSFQNALFFFYWQDFIYKKIFTSLCNISFTKKVIDFSV